MNPFNLTGQKVLIIGGSSGMGFESARLAKENGATVVIAGRSQEKLDQASRELNDVQTYAVNATNENEVETMLRELSPLDHLVVTASANTRAAGITDTSIEQAQQAFRNRFWLSYNVLHFGKQYLKETGSITLLSGSSGRRPVAGLGVWGALHGSIEALAKAAAIELAPVRVNTISPGGIGIRSDRNLVHYAGQPKDVAQMVLAVLTNPALTNAVIDVDGGERLGNWS